MRSFFNYLAKRYRLPMRSGLGELDLQIEKLRILRDSYQTALQDQRHICIQIIDPKQDVERLCTQ